MEYQPLKQGRNIALDEDKLFGTNPKRETHNPNCQSYAKLYTMKENEPLYEANCN